MVKKTSMALMLILLFTFVIGGSSIAFANDKKDAGTSNLQKAFNNVASKNTDGDTVVGEEAMKKVNGLSGDAIDIASTIAMTVLICACIWTASRLSTVGDNANKKLSIKGAILLQIAGILYLANVISFINFSFNNLKIF